MLVHWPLLSNIKPVGCVSTLKNTTVYIQTGIFCSSNCTDEAMYHTKRRASIGLPTHH